MVSSSLSSLITKVRILRSIPSSRWLLNISLLDPFNAFLIVEATQPYSKGYKQLASGLTCGLSSLAAGFAIGIVGDAGVRANAQQE
jgi:ATP synthase subunit C